ncbi:MAG: MotA/TolQ/ExbB proton channel family protein, partial [Bacteroidota bacterium]
MLSSALLNAFYLLQASTTVPASEKKDESILDIIMNSSFSGQVVLIILLILSVVAVYIIVERYLTISRAGQVDHNFMNSIRMSVESGNLQAA